MSPASLDKGVEVGYGSVAFVVFAFLAIRIWMLYGPKIPLIFIGLLVLGQYALPEMFGPYRFPLFVTLLTIVLLLIDRFKAVRWNLM